MPSVDLDEKAEQFPLSTNIMWKIEALFFPLSNLLNIMLALCQSKSLCRINPEIKANKN